MRAAQPWQVMPNAEIAERYDVVGFGVVCSKQPRNSLMHSLCNVDRYGEMHPVFVSDVEHVSLDTEVGNCGDEKRLSAGDSIGLNRGVRASSVGASSSRVLISLNVSAARRFVPVSSVQSSRTSAIAA